MSGLFRPSRHSRESGGSGQPKTNLWLRLSHHRHSHVGGNPTPSLSILKLRPQKPPTRELDSRLRGNDEGNGWNDEECVVEVTS
jgi:hypothetical protein